MHPRTEPRVNALILIIEDNEDDKIFTLRALSRNGVDADDVVAVRDGVEALDYLFARGRYSDRDPSCLPHLILLDINLPRLSGHEVLERLRQEARTQLIPVVMFSSSSDDRDVVAGYSGGVNSYVQKPVDTQEFDRIVQSVAAYWLGLNRVPAGEPETRI